MATIQHVCRIVAQKKICGKFFLLQLDAGPLTKKVLPGQFIHIRVTNGLEPFFRRPFSVHRAGRTVDILYEVVGRGTEILSEKRKGDVLDILGPLGNTFSMPSPETRTVVMVAGGVGIAPFLLLSDKLQKKNVDLMLLYGARSREHVFSMDKFRRNGVKVFVATEDGLVGVKGRVSKLFDKIPTDPRRVFIYTCGPRPMMAAVQEFCFQHDLKGEASCEERMACGLGACRGCVVKTKSGYKTACYDGPVFDLGSLVFKAEG